MKSLSEAINRSFKMRIKIHNRNTTKQISTQINRIYKHFSTTLESVKKDKIFYSIFEKQLTFILNLNQNS